MSGAIYAANLSTWFTFLVHIELNIYNRKKVLTRSRNGQETCLEKRRWFCIQIYCSFIWIFIVIFCYTSFSIGFSISWLSDSLKGKLVKAFWLIFLFKMFNWGTHSVISSLVFEKKLTWNKANCTEGLLTKNTVLVAQTKVENSHGVLSAHQSSPLLLLHPASCSIDIQNFTWEYLTWSKCTPHFSILHEHKFTKIDYVT